MPTFACIHVFLWYFMQLLTSLEQRTVHRREVWLETFLQANNCNVDLQYWRRLSNLADWDLITDRRRETFDVATKPLTGMNVSDSHLNFGVGWNDPPVSPLPRNLFIKPFVYDKISCRKLSAPFLPFFFPLRVLFRWKCHWKMDESISTKWNIALPLMTLPVMFTITVDQCSMLTCTFIRFPHFRFRQMKLEMVNYSWNELGSDSLFIMSGYFH